MNKQLVRFFTFLVDWATAHWAANLAKASNHVDGQGLAHGHVWIQETARFAETELHAWQSGIDETCGRRWQSWAMPLQLDKRHFWPDS